MKTLVRAPVIMLTLAVSATAFAGQITLPTTLDNLLPSGDFAMVGDLKFDLFEYTIIGDMPAAENVNVLEIKDEKGYPGIRFQAPFEDTVSGDGSDALISFQVSAATPIIAGARLQANPDLLDGVPDTGVAAVTETFLPEISDDSISAFDNGVIEQLSEEIHFPAPVATLNVQKDILLSSADGGAGAVLSFVDQTFPVVPEPTTVSLMMLGMAG